MKNKVVINIWSTAIQLFQKLSLGFNLFILCSVIIFFDLTKTFNIYTTMFSWSVLSFILKTLTALSIIYIVLQFKLIKWKAFVPLILNSFTIWVLFSSSYTSIIWDIRMKLELKINKPKYEELIEKFENKELPDPDENGHIRLSQIPREFIIVDKTNTATSIFFDTGTGFHNYIGFMYRSDDSQPPTTEFMGTYWLSCEHQELHWYYCSSN